MVVGKRVYFRGRKFFLKGEELLRVEGRRDGKRRKRGNDKAKNRR